MAYIRTCVQNLGEIRRPVRNNCPSSLIIDYSPSAIACVITLGPIMTGLAPASNSEKHSCNAASQSPLRPPPALFRNDLLTFEGVQRPTYSDKNYGYWTLRRRVSPSSSEDYLSA